VVRVFSFIKPYRIAITIAIILMLAELAVELWQPLLMAKIIDEGILKNDLSIVMLWGGIMVGISVLAFFGGIINSFYASHVSQHFGYDVREHLFNKVQAFSFSNFNRFPTSSLITRLTNDVTQLQNTIFMSLRIMMRAPLLVIGGTIMAFTVNVKLASILAFAIPLLIVFLVFVMKKGGRLFRTVQEKLDAVNSVVQENLIGIRHIKAYLRSKHEIKRFTGVNQKLKNQTTRALQIMETTMPVLLIVMNAAILLILWTGSRQINAGEIKVGELVAIVNYSTRITGAFSVFSFIIMALSRAKASSNRISEVLNTDIDLIDNTDNLTTSGIYGEVMFQNVSFQYPGTSTAVLKNLSFTVRQGQTVAIMGATGSGKTSLFQLIPRLYEATSGQISMDGKEIQSYKMDHLRRRIGFVPQESLLFTGSIKENIAWGKEDATMDEVIKAAESAQIHDTIRNLPNGYDTKLGQKGVNLSGGQKQRLSIARALVRKPNILMLDDSTSALDLKTEAKLLDALREYEATTFIITQKISSAMNADKILLLDEGQLIEEGSHQELLTRSKLYQRIVQSQFGEEALLHVQTSK
jgi:ATP-binding cassette subfamily B multidrug efflux pump